MSVIPRQPTADDLHRLMAELQDRLPIKDARDRVTVAEVLDAYMKDAKKEIGASTYENRVRDVDSFRARFGPRLVADCSPLDLKQWMEDNTKRWPSGWSKLRVNGTIQRAFNWAYSLRMIRENPFRGYRTGGDKKHGRDMSLDEFQAVLRHTDPYFRRFMIALKLTGARPGELSALKWHHIDWTRCIAVMPTHKTAKKTGKPRWIVLVPQVMKLLAIIKRDQHGPAAVELRRILLHADDRTVRAKEVVRRMTQLGYTYRAIYAARQVIGAEYKRVGGWREHGYTVYHLPDGATSKNPPSGDYVFVCSKMYPWKRTALGTKFKRLRKLIGLPADCKMYGTRHLFCTWAIKRGVNLKAVATLLGHSTTQMVERVYTHIDGDFEFLQASARAATALTGVPQPLPTPNDVEAWQAMVLTKYPQASPKPQKPKTKPGPRVPKAAERIAYKAYQFAVKECPKLKTDLQVFEWLIGRREYAGQLPPSIATFRRYLHCARTHFEGACKRVLRRKGKQKKGNKPCN